MVHVYNCHPFSSQQIVQVKWNLTEADPASGVFYYLRSSSLLSLSVAQVEKEPGLVCCGGGAIFVVATGGCKVALMCLCLQFVTFLKMYLF